ncbi:MAG: hypothetical protein U1A78_23075 [Polyangia bacterium]
MSTTPRLHVQRQGYPADAVPGRFRTLQYQPTPGERWYHVLFGHVPRFQMDFILRPELPCRKFRPQHFAHLGPQIKFLSPASAMQFAVSIGNLSSNDTQHVAGRGGLSLVVSVRVADLRDHAQRESPVFAHALVAIDEPLEPDGFSHTIESFVGRVLNEGLLFYRNYYASGQADNFERVYGYVRSLRDLPAPDDSMQGSAACYSSDDPPPYNQILIDCRGADGPDVLRLAARLGVILYRTNLKWTTITTGSEELEPKIYQGEDYSIAVRLICSGPSLEELEQQARDAAPTSRVFGCSLAELPASDAELGARLFGLSVGMEAAPRDAALSSLTTMLQPRMERDRDSDAAGAARTQAPVSLTASGLQLGDVLLSRPESAFLSPGAGAGEGERTQDGARPGSGWLLAFACGVVGLLIGGAAVWMLRPQFVPGSSAKARPEPPSLKVRELAAPSGRGEPTVAPAADSAAPADVVTEDGGGQLAFRRALAAELQQQAVPISELASRVQARARRVSDGGGSDPWRRLLSESERLKVRLDKLNHIVSVFGERRTVYGTSSLVESYCEVLSAQEAMNKIIRDHRLSLGPNP